MADGNSTGPAIAEIVTPIPSVIQPNSFATELTDDQVNLQLMNNHVIRRLVEDYNAAANPFNQRIYNITENVRDEIATAQTAMDNGYNVAQGQNSLADDRTDAQNTRGIIAARAEITKLEAAMDEGIQTELELVANAFYEIASKFLNPSNPTATEIRRQIAEIDAQIDGLAEQAAALMPIKEKYNGANTSFTSENRERLTPLIRDLDGSPATPPITRLNGGGVGPQHETWQDYFDSHNLTYSQRASGLVAIDRKMTEITVKMDQLADSYPAPYKQYQKLLNGYSPSEQRTDWWAIATAVTWFLLEEGAWMVAAAAVAPITGGIGAAAIASARMIKRSSAMGAAVVGAVGGAVKAARWFAELPDRVQQKAFDSFQRAWGRVRRRLPVRGGRPAGQVQGTGDASRPRTSPRCSACAM